MSYEKKKQLHILVQLAMSDNRFTDSEKNAIRTLGNSYGIDEPTIESIIEKPDMQESLSVLQITQKMDFLIDCMAVLLADKEIHASEDQFIRSLAKKLGFKDQVITFLMEYHTMERGPLKDMMLKYLG